MASLFSARRKPKRIAREDASQAEIQDDDTGPAVRRPGAVKNKSKLRVSFNPGDEDVEGSSNVQSEVDNPILRSSSRLGASAALQDRLKQTSLRENDDVERPSYSKSYLDELRNSTPSTPQPTSTTPSEDEQHMLDIESKFGPSKSSLSSTANTITVPSTSEIAEKKARRARLALGQDPASEANPHSQSQSEDYISLSAYDSDGEFKPQRLQVGTYIPPSSTKETSIALEREDEDIAEGFEQFIEDNADAVRGRYKTSSLHLNRKSKRAHAQQERQHMQSLIDKAEASHSDSNDSDSSASESGNERRHAYETSQTHYGLDGLASHKSHKVKQRRPQQPRETTPIVKLSVGLNRLREQVQRISEEKSRIERRLGEVRREKVEVQERKGVVQRELEGLGREVESLQRGKEGVNGGDDGNAKGSVERGLESIGRSKESPDEMDVG